MVEDGSFQDKLNQLRDWELAIIEEGKGVLENEDDYEPLPSQYEIDEYGIMDDFCEGLEDDKREMCLNVLSGRGAFRRFKDLIYRLNIENDWYQYKDTKLKELAVNWCEELGLPYTLKEN